VINDDLNERNARLGGFVELPALEQYAQRYAEHLVMHRDGGILEVRTHTDGSSAVFSRGMLNAWGQALSDIGRDPDTSATKPGRTRRGSTAAHLSDESSRLGPNGACLSTPAAHGSTSTTSRHRSLQAKRQTAPRNCRHLLRAGLEPTAPGPFVIGP
jgi:hypothetical protein